MYKFLFVKLRNSKEQPNYCFKEINMILFGAYLILKMQIILNNLIKPS